MPIMVKPGYGFANKREDDKKKLSPAVSVPCVPLFLPSRYLKAWLRNGNDHATYGSESHLHHEKLDIDFLPIDMVSQGK